MIKRVVFFLVAISFSLSILGQEGIPVYQDYLTSSWYLIHPAMAGAAEKEQIRLTGRQQWFDIEDAPSFYTASINGRLGKQIGAGAIVFNDSNVNFSRTGFYGTMGYHINLNYRAIQLHQLSFGFSLGLLQRRLDERDLIDPLRPDPIITGAVSTSTQLNADFGLAYFYQNFFAIQSFKNIFPSEIQNSGNTVLEPEGDFRSISTFGYTFDIGRSGFNLEPSFSVEYAAFNNSITLDNNLKTYYPLNNETTLWGGLSYRINSQRTTPSSASNPLFNLISGRFQTISPFIGVDHKQFVFAYTYTHQLNGIKISNSGFHQLTLGYNFEGNKKFRFSRYNCNCPAIK